MFSYFYPPAKKKYITLFYIIFNSYNMYIECDLPISNIKNISSKPRLKHEQIIVDDFCSIGMNNAFITFKSILLKANVLVYENKIKEIICYNLDNFSAINKIKSPYKREEIFFTYFFDKKEGKDLLLYISIFENHIIVYKIPSFDKLLEINKIYNIGPTYSACFLEEEKLVIITGSSHREGIKIIDLEGNIELFPNSEYSIRHVDNYCEHNMIYIIISCNNGILLSFLYKEKSKYKKYIDSNEEKKDNYTEIAVF